MIQFNKPLVLGTEIDYISNAIDNKKLSGDGTWGLKCQQWFENHLSCPKTLMVPSCTHGLEMSAILANIQPGDEVIMPSYAFTSTANAFVLRGATVVFIDVNPDTMNVDETKIELAITAKTKAIVVIHYGGVGCEMDTIMDIAETHNLFVIEDAAQAMMATYKNRRLGTIGHFGVFSFHETKNYTSGGEGGLLIINDNKFTHQAEVIREKGTNRSQFQRGEVNKYNWVKVGSSYLPSELQSAYLYAQLVDAEKVNDRRLEIWSNYHVALQPLVNNGDVEVAKIAEHCVANGHLYYIKLIDFEQRCRFIEYMKNNKILCPFHYVPLHSAPAGEKYSRFAGDDTYTSHDSGRLVRLPIYFDMTNDEQDKVIEKVFDFFNN